MHINYIIYLFLRCSLKNYNSKNIKENILIIFILCTCVLEIPIRLMYIPSLKYIQLYDHILKLQTFCFFCLFSYFKKCVCHVTFGMENAVSSCAHGSGM